MRTDTKRIALFLIVAAYPLAACGGDDDASGSTDGTSGASADVTVVASDSLEFDADDYTTDAGDVTFHYEGGNIQHSLVVEGHEDDMRLLIQGNDDDGSLVLEAGEYRLYCDIAGHAEAGMEATLVVE
jgi:plastocyanin